MKLVRICDILFLVYLISLLGCTNSTENKNIETALTSFEIADGFQMELIASEPLISDPVAMEIDEDGRMYVVEMHGYPLDKSGSGNVKLLMDTDGDGVMDESTVFANDLQFPTGVLRWKQGILVTDPPNVLYFEDKDGDGQAEIRDTLLYGFAVSNPQHNVNNPILGLDNWIYISNEPAVRAKVYTEEFGDLGSALHFYDLGVESGIEVNGGGRRVRFKPDHYQLESTSSRSQFGHTINEWGHHFLTSNANHIFQEVIQSPYLERNSNLQVSNSTEIVSDHGHAAEVYPITDNPQHQLLTDLGVFTSACGIMAYGGGLFPSDFDHSVFVSEPVSNLLHVDKVVEKGTSHVASRQYEKKEFLASKDPWFRPVNNYVGPDGALYVVDYYRRIIEHPEWMADDVVESGIVYDGVDQGRIYRITPVGSGASDWTTKLTMSKQSDIELVDHLSSKNIWFRRNAQRMLIDRGNESIVEELKKVVESSASPMGRLHAAWTLEGMNGLTTDLILKLLKDPVAGIRQNAILLSESYLEEEEIVKGLIGLQKDVNARVRFQLMCTLGYIETSEVERILMEMTMENIDDHWMQIASLSTPSPNLDKILDQAIEEYSEDENAFKSYVSRIVSMISSQNEVSQIKGLIQQALRPKIESSQGWRIAILQGLISGRGHVDYASKAYERERELLYEVLFSNHPSALKETCLSLISYMGLPKNINESTAIEKSLAIIHSSESLESDRINAIRFLALTNYSSLRSTLEKLLVPQETMVVQKVVLQSLSSIQGDEFPGYILGKWNTLLSDLRDEAVRLLLSSEKGNIELIKALETGVVDPSAIEWRRQVGMMAQPNDELRQRSREIFSNKVDDEEKQKILARYEDVDQIKGDVERGLEVFKQNCATCHQIGGEYGTAYGPDLASIRNRKSQSIIKDILDPGLSIADGYELWEIKLQDGRTKQGIISSQSSNSINLRILGSEDEVISRSDISEMSAKNISVMPSGLENQIDKSGMADLLTFIKKLTK